MFIQKIQRQFQILYQVEPGLQMEDFLISRERMEELPRKDLTITFSDDVQGMMLLFPGGEWLGLAVYIHDEILDNLTRNDPTVDLNSENFHDFCVLTEELSHFLYFTWKANQSMQVTKLELELQAEIDKFVLSALYLGSQNDGCIPKGLKSLLFEDCRFRKGMPQRLRERYGAANNLAMRYCHFLEARYIASNRLPDMVREVRQFYRLGQTDKISHINRKILGC